MALTLNTRYGTRATEPSIDYPTGGFKNKSSPDALDGTPLERDWANDFLGARDAILKAAGIIANGTAETAEASQVLEALRVLGLRQSTESTVGVQKIATTLLAQGLVNNTDALTPKKLADAFKGGNQSLTANGYQKHPGGTVEQWFTAANTNDLGTAWSRAPFPIAFPTACLAISITAVSSIGTGLAANFATYTGFSNTAVDWVAYDTDGTPSSSPGSIGIIVRAIGY